jgi:hypothetical protein
MLSRYAKGTRAEKGEVLDQLVAVTGWHCDPARKALRRAAAAPASPASPSPRSPRREPVLTYGQPVVDALVTCPAVLDGPCGKRLRPSLPALVGHGELGDDPAVMDALLAMSAATMDRRLKPHRAGLVAGKGRSMTRPGSLLKSGIPLKT